MKFKTTTQLKKGCGKKFMWIEYLKDKRICGQIEDLKHSEHIILCQDCNSRLEQIKGIIKIIEEMINNIATNPKELALAGHKRACCIMTLKELLSKLKGGNKI